MKSQVFLWVFQCFFSLGATPMTIRELIEDILRPLGLATFFRHTMGTVCMYELVYVYICKYI